MKNRLLVALTVAALLFVGVSFPAAVSAGGASSGIYCHVVRRGETVTTIAAQYGLSTQAIVQANHLANPNVIYVGQCLVIPTSQPACGACSRTHVVKPGDYLKQIAAKNGSSWQCIAQANGLKNPNLIYPGQRLVVPVKCHAPKPGPKPTPKPTGPWTALYWPNQYLSGDPKLTTHPASVDFNWGTKGPGDGIPGTYFSARFTTDQYFALGKYRFRIRVDDGVRFWLDGILLIDQWKVTAPVEYTSENQLSAGEHHIQIDYYQAWGEGLITFSSELVNGAPAWTCEYFNNTNLQVPVVTTQYYQALNFDWGNKAPAAGVTADYFSTRCSGQFTFVGGKYQFSTTVDDGVRLYVDDSLKIDQWHLSTPTTYTADVDLGAGTHTVKVEYFENNGIAVLKALWTQR